MPVKPNHNDAPLRARRPASRRGLWRLYAVGAGLCLLLIAVAGRLLMLQVIDGEEYADIARRQYESRTPLQADRGAIYDRNGTLLATSVPAFSFAVDPKHVEHPEELATAFARAFGGERADYLKKIKTPKTSFVWIRRKMLGEKVNQLRQIKDEGLITISEPLRRFEHGRFGSQIVGCVNLDNNGLSGVELYYDETLRGRDGYVIMQRDALGRRHLDVDLPRVDPAHGENLELTIDMTVQSIVEDELAKGISDAGAKAGTAIALDPKTGEILALASYPNFDPNNMVGADQSGIRPRGITDTYEPGSTMKAITAAAALQEGVVTTDDMIDGENGEYRLSDGSVVRDDHPMGVVSFADAFRESSNVIFSKVANRVDHSTFYKYVRDFGFGMPTGIDLPGEVRGDVKKPDEFSEETQAFMSYGYQLAVTPLQLAVAYAAIANGGNIIRPYILKRRLDTEGETVEEYQPQIVRQVVSPETASTVRNLLRAVVDSGTGRAARVAGIAVAGKTGTAQQLSEGGYANGRYNASFIGFFPAEDPEMVLLVLLQDPSNGYYGGQVAAPVFASIARRVVNATMVDRRSQFLQTQLHDENGPGTGENENRSIIVPDLRGLDREALRRYSVDTRLRVIPDGKGKRVLSQTPVPGTTIASRDVVRVNLGEGEESDRMPDLTGLSLRRALAIAGEFGMQPRIAGNAGGMVKGQKPDPGTRVSRNQEEVTLYCR